MGFEALQAAGLYDSADTKADERRELLELLLAEGCTLEEMQMANSRGRLFEPCRRRG